MEKSISRFKATIQDLTEISKIQRALQEDVQEGSLPEVLEEVLSDQRRLIEETKAEMVFDFHSATSVRFSKRNLRSIYYNLINNSLKYRFPGRTPEIRVKTEKK